MRALRARGVDTIGIDLSRVLLRQAEPATTGPLVQADMRRIPLATGALDAVVSFFTSFGYFADPADDRRVLEEVARVIRPDGGGYFLDFLDRDSVISSLVPKSQKNLPDGTKIDEQRWIEDERVKKRVTVHRPGETEPSSYVESVRLYGRDEIEVMTTQVGLTVEAAYGDFEGGGVGTGSRLLMIFRRRS